MRRVNTRSIEQCVYARSAYGSLVLYTIFDVSVRPSVRPSAKIACFVIGSKSRELASRVNTKVICEKMTKKRSFFSRISIGVRKVASPSLGHQFSFTPVNKTRKILMGGGA